jgi:hypothetical protein
MPTRARIPRIVTATAVVVAALAVGCGGRPDVDVWEGRWLDLADDVPVASLAADPPQRERCDEVLGRLRDALPALRPAPTDVLDDAVEAWGEFAESVFFECPLGRGEHAGWEEAAVELQRLRVEIEAEIEFERARAG